MKYKALALSILLASSTASALQPPSNDADWYYSLGGEQTVSSPLSYTTNSIVLGGSANWGAGFNCSAFNPTLGVANTLNKVKAGIDSFQQQLVGAATSAIASLPMLMLQRANPGLYDMLMSASAAAEGRVTLATKSCELAMKQIGEGKNPYSDWITLSRTATWKDQMGTGATNSASVDIIEAKKKVEDENGDKGVDWINGGPAGGIGQPAIHIPSDVVQAGYNQTLNRSASSNAAAPANTGRMGDLWRSPAEAKAWSRSVLGEEQIRTYKNSPTNSLPGRGLAFEINKEVEVIKPLLNDLITGASPASIANLEKVSAPNIFISSELIASLKTINTVDRSILTAKLTQEIATARTVEKALMMRRLIQSGIQEPNIYASGKGYDAATKYIATLDSAINSVLFEAEINKKITSTTSKTITALGRQLVNQGNATAITQPKDTRLPVGGAVMVAP